MTGNDLFEPLRGSAAAPSRTVRNVAVGVGIGFACVIGVGLGVLLDGRAAGEPEVVGTIEHVPALPGPVLVTAVAAPAPLADATQHPSSVASALFEAREPDRPVGQSVEIQNGVKIYRPVMGGRGMAVIKVPQFSAEAPIDRNAASPASIPADAAPHVALLYGGLGFDRAASARAATELPAGVTFGFTPYGEGLAAQVQFARNAGHEIVLQLPMEGVGRTEVPPAHMLTTDPARSADDLAWLLNRISGYGGVSNLLGTRLMASDTALRPVAQALADRRLYFLEDGDISRSALQPIAREIGLQAGKADVVLDARGGAVALAQDLARLEDVARHRGSAIGTVIAAPGAAQVVAQFVARLPQKGLALVSVGQAVQDGRATASAGLAFSR